uniref:NIT domain GCY 5 n=1 Tax=Placozoa sp. H4 TaxID=1034858 RepID=A0A7G7LKC3_9METZ|nr:NIT domain GCY 5 [Placozoa sp. H4]
MRIPLLDRLLNRRSSSTVHIFRATQITDCIQNKMNNSMESGEGDQEDYYHEKKPRYQSRVDFCLIISILVVLCGTMMIFSLINYFKLSSIVGKENMISDRLQIVTECLKMNQQLLEERDVSSYYVNNNYSISFYQDKVIPVRHSTDRYLTYLYLNSLQNNSALIIDKYRVRQLLVQYRPLIDSANRSSSQIFQFYTNLITQNHKIAVNYIQQVDVVHFWHDVASFVFVLRGMESLEAEQITGSLYFENGQFPDKYHQLAFVSQASEKQLFAHQAMKHSVTCAYLYKQEFCNTTLIEDIEEIESFLGSNQPMLPDPKRHLYWLNLTTTYNQKLYIIAQKLGQSIITSNSLSEILHYHQLPLSVATMIIVLTAALFLGLAVGRFLCSSYATIKATVSQTEIIEMEKETTDRLLDQLLPPTVAQQLKQCKTVRAETFDDVTIYCSDICGFTNICHSWRPIQVVYMLNGLYTLFDRIIDRYSVYKLETIGDAYIAVSGAPKQLQHRRHAREIACMALDIVEGMKVLRIPNMPDLQLCMRIGIHTGPCAAGVVGLKMPRYCLFGDTVNLASKIESTGKASQIHVSHTTYEALEEIGGYEMVFDEVKCLLGLGNIPTYWLIGKKKTQPLRATASMN